VLWYTAFGICSSAAGFFALRIVEAGLDGVGIARRVYALTCFSGMLCLVMLAVAPDANIGGADVLLVSGIAFNVTRTVSVIWVNRRTTSDVLATGALVPRPGRVHRWDHRRIRAHPPSSPRWPAFRLRSSPSPARL
jgi:hypothetical protein